MPKFSLLQYPKNSKNELVRQGDPLRFLCIVSQIIEKIEGGPFGDFFQKMSHKVKKTERGPFSLARYCMLRGKKENPLRFSSQGQQVQFKIL